MIGAFQGYKKGLIAAISSIIGVLISLLGAFWLYRPTAIFLDNQFLLSERISPWISQKLALPVDSLDNRLSTTLSDGLAAAVNKLEVPDFIKDLMLNHLTQNTSLPVASGLTTVSQGLVAAVTSLFLSALSFLLVYIFFKFIFQIFLPKIFSSISPRPIKALDRLAGSVLGAGAGVLSIIIVTIVLTPLASMSALKGNEGFLVNQMGGSTVVNIVMNYIGTLW